MRTPPLAARLEMDDSNPTVTVFPDGSVDRFYEVFVGGDRVETREAFGDGIGRGQSQGSGESMSAGGRTQQSGQQFYR